MLSIRTLQLLVHLVATADSENMDLNIEMNPMAEEYSYSSSISATAIGATHQRCSYQITARPKQTEREYELVLDPVPNDNKAAAAENIKIALLVTVIVNIVVLLLLIAFAIILGGILIQSKFEQVSRRAQLTAVNETHLQ